MLRQAIELSLLEQSSGISTTELSQNESAEAEATNAPATEDDQDLITFDPVKPPDAPI